MTEQCPWCGAPEIESDSPRTTYSCGSLCYDQRDGTWQQSALCRQLCHSAHTNRMGCCPESPKDPLSEIIDPATVKRILDLTCEKAQLELDRFKRRRRRFSIIGDNDPEPTAEERAKKRERRRLFNEREHREIIASLYRQMAECHELTARLYKGQGLEEEAKEEMNNAIAASNDSTDVYFEVLEIEKELYQKHEEMFGVDDDVEVDD
jgi:hypothetical protein